MDVVTLALDAPEQQSLRLVPDTAARPTVRSHTERADAWLASNSWFLPAVVDLIQARIDAGWTSASVKRAAAVVIWHHELDNSEPVRFDNNYAATVAERVVMLRPEWDGIVWRKAAA